MLDTKWNLRPKLISETVDRLSRRIKERSPKAGLSEVCNHLAVIANDASCQAADISQPIIAVRVVVGLLIGLIGLGLVATVTTLESPAAQLDFLSFVLVLESDIKDVVLISIGVYLLVSLERRIKKVRALKAIR